MTDVNILIYNDSDILNTPIMSADNAEQVLSDLISLAKEDNSYLLISSGLLRTFKQTFYSSFENTSNHADQLQLDLV